MKLSTSFLSAILLTFSLIAFTETSAQVTDRAKEKAERKTNQRVDQKIDKGIDKGLDAIEGLFKKKDKKKKKSENQEESSEQSNQDRQEQQNAMMGLFGGGSVEVQEEYQFDHTMDMHVQMYDEKGKATDEMEYTMLFSESNSYFGMYGTNQGTSFKMIFDYGKLQMITMPETQQGGPSYGMVMSMDESMLEGEENDSEMEANDVTFVETGRTKTINGYSCKEYKLENEEEEDYETFVWTTMDSDMEWTSFFQTMSEQQKMNMQMPDSYPEGMVVQTVMESTENDEKTVMTIKNVKKNSNETLSTAGYQFMNLNGDKK